VRIDLPYARSCATPQSLARLSKPPHIRAGWEETTIASTDIRDLGPERSQDAIQFIEHHGLGHIIDQINDQLSVLTSQGLPIKSVEFTVADDWDEDDRRLHVTVYLDTDLMGAYAAWKDARPGLTRAASFAEEKGLLDFEFATANR